MGVRPEQLESPHAVCTCVRDRGRRLAAYEEGSAASGATIAVEDGTAAVEFSLADVPSPMAAGEALVYPLGVPQRLPAGDWHATLFFRTSARPPRPPRSSSPRPPSPARPSLTSRDEEGGS